MTTFQDFLDDTAAKGKATGKDFAWVSLTVDGIVKEAKVIWIEAGGYPKEFPPAEPGWGGKWNIVRCAEQPKATTINLRTGKFLKAMPNIKIER